MECLQGGRAILADEYKPYAAAVSSGPERECK
jgi:hypothetical protein